MTETIREKVTTKLPNRLSYEEFLTQYSGIHAEWVDGEVIEMPSVSLKHQDVSRFLLRLISDFVEVHSLGKVLYEKFQMRIASRPAGREPDIIFLSNAHLELLTPTFLNGPGDLVIEVISPESIERDRVDKFGEYQRGGVGEYWLIDPMQQQADFFQRGSDGYFHSISPDDGVYQCPTLPGFWLRVDWLWQNPSPPLTQVRKELGL